MAVTDEAIPASNRGSEERIVDTVLAGTYEKSAILGQSNGEARKQVLAPPVGDRQTAVTAERLEGDLRARRVLAPLVLRGVHHAQDTFDQLLIEPDASRSPNPRSCST